MSYPSLQLQQSVFSGRSSTLSGLGRCLAFGRPGKLPHRIRIGTRWWLRCECDVGARRRTTERYSYLFNPYTLMTCFARSSTSLDNVFVLLAIRFASRGEQLTVDVKVQRTDMTRRSDIRSDLFSIGDPCFAVSCSTPPGNDHASRAKEHKRSQRRREHINVRGLSWRARMCQLRHRWMGVDVEVMGDNVHLAF